MSRPAAIVSHALAGRLTPVRLGVRLFGAENGSAAPDGPPFLAGALFPGTQRLGPVELRLACDASGEQASYAVSLANRSPRSLGVTSVVLGFRWSGHGAGSLRFLRHGWQSWSFTGSRDLDDAGEPPFPSGPWLRGLHHAVGDPPPDRAGWHESDLVAVIGASPSGPVCLAGLHERGRSFGVVYARRDGRDVEVEVEARLDAWLEPGASRELENAWIALGEDANDLLEDFADAHGREAEARTGARFQSGWCSWYHFFHDVSEDDIRRNLDALASARDEIPVEVVQIDDGYQRAVGDWLETNPKFPRGLAPLAGEIRAAGFRAGLWTAPFCAVRESRFFAEHRNWLLRADHELFRGLLHPQWSADGSVFVLDTSRDAVTDHLQRVFTELAQMGFDYQKLDFLYTAAMQAGASDPFVTRAERLRRGLDAVRAGAGEAAFLLGCGCPLGAAVGVVDGMRIGPDVAPSWDVAAGASIPGIEATQPSLRNAVRNVLCRAWMHRRLWLNDPDCLMVRSRDTRLTSAEARTLATAISVTGGMLVFSDDVSMLSKSERARVREALDTARAVDAADPRGSARALDLLATEMPRTLMSRTAQGGLLALVSDADEAVARRVGPETLDARLGLQPLFGSPAPRVLEDGAFEVELEAHDSALLRFRSPLPLAVFCDFDGTFAVQDVGATIAERHSGDRRPALWERYLRGEISAWEYNMQLLDGLPLPPEELDAFLHTIELSPGAVELLAWCAERAVPFRILSDGFGYNLDRLQEIRGVRFAYDANSLRYEQGRWRISPGHPNPACGCGTGTCKRGRIAEYRAQHPRHTLVHVGNGRVSDLCGALAADVAFAKDSLAVELEKRGVRFEAFRDLRDVVSGLERLARYLASRP